MGSLCIGGESNGGQEGVSHGGSRSPITDAVEKQKLLAQYKKSKHEKKKSKHKYKDENINNDSSTDSEDGDSTPDENDNPKFDQLQVEQMQKEVIVLSTRNANLEQQLDEMKQKYEALQKQKSADEAEVKYDLYKP